MGEPESIDLEIARRMDELASMLGDPAKMTLIVITSESHDGDYVMTNDVVEKVICTLEHYRNKDADYLLNRDGFHPRH